MTDAFIYLDNHSTTRCDPQVAEAMMPYLCDAYGNAHSPHRFGIEAKGAFERARATIAGVLGADETEIVLTSGATEANNLALLGVATHPRNRRRTMVAAATEHPAVLDPLKELARQGFEVRYVPVHSQNGNRAGQVDLEQLRTLISDDTCLVSVMAANNEIGVLQDLRSVAELCHEHGALLHCDATQAVGRIPIDVDDLGIDLLSASAHKVYGPKGVGVLFVRQRGRRVKILPQIWGGGQQMGLRSGTLNVAGAVAMAEAMRLAEQSMSSEPTRIRTMRDQLWESLSEGIDGLVLNGPDLESNLRLDANLNFCLPRVEGETLISSLPGIALSSGSACSSVDPEPSHVLRAIGLSESEARRSLRLGIGRFNTAEEMTRAAEQIIDTYHQLADSY